MSLIFHGTQVEKVIYHNTELDYVYYHGQLVYESTRYVAKPTLSGSFTFDNTPKTPTITGYNSAAMVQSGTTSATAAGSYSVTYTLRSGYAWTDGTTTPVTLTWSIAKRVLTAPTLTNTSFTWATGRTFAPTVNNFNSAYMVQSGTASSTNAGSFTVTWALRYPASTTWSDGTTANKSATWSVAKLSLAVPTLSGTSFAFIEGTTRTVTVSGFNSTYETQTGTTSAAALNTYSVSWSLRYPANSQWADGTTGTKTKTWSIVWVNGTSHYAADLYNKGWYKADSLQFTDYSTATSGVVSWNSDHLAIQFTKLRTAELHYNKTFHAIVKAEVVKGNPPLPAECDIKAFSDSWASSTLLDAQAGTSYAEISALNDIANRYAGLQNASSPSSGFANQHRLAIQRIWIT